MEQQPTLTPAEKHYNSVKKAVQKYQSNNRDICRQRCRDWADNLRSDPDKYRKYLDEKNVYMKKMRQTKKETSVRTDESKGHNGCHPSHISNITLV